MAIQWNILSNALASNPGEALQRGMEQGVTRSAMGALGRNPNDQQATNALMAFNPQAGMAMQDRQASQATAAAQARRLSAQAQEDEIGNTQNMILAGASFLDGVQDEAGYQSARQRFLQAFPNAPQPPESFDPAYVNNVRTTAQQLQAYRASRTGQGGGGGMTTFQRELAGAGIFPGSPAYAAAIANRMQPPYMVVPPGGQTQRNPGWVDPMSLPGTPPGQQGAAPGQQQPQVVAALPPGFVFEDEGGAEPGAPATFPDEWQPTDSRYPAGQW